MWVIENMNQNERIMFHVLIFCANVLCLKIFMFLKNIFVYLFIVYLYVYFGMRTQGRSEKNLWELVFPFSFCMLGTELSYLLA